MAVQSAVPTLLPAPRALASPLRSGLHTPAPHPSSPSIAASAARRASQRRHHAAVSEGLHPRRVIGIAEVRALSNRTGRCGQQQICIAHRWSVLGLPPARLNLPARASPHNPRRPASRDRCRRSRSRARRRSCPSTDAAASPGAPPFRRPARAAVPRLGGDHLPRALGTIAVSALRTAQRCPAAHPAATIAAAMRHSTRVAPHLLQTPSPRPRPRRRRQGPPWSPSACLPNKGRTATLHPRSSPAPSPPPERHAVAAAGRRWLAHQPGTGASGARAGCMWPRAAPWSAPAMGPSREGGRPRPDCSLPACPKA
eukprot:351609-Chlamydomonas_euryale.AAC.3